MATLSVVIPCYNGASTIARQLQALKQQQVPGIELEIVVADNGSTDGSAEIASSYREATFDVRSVDASAKQGINHARNVGVQASSGRWVLFCDADDVVQPGWAEAHYRALSAGATLVGGPTQPVTNDGTPTGAPIDTDFVNNLGFLSWPTGANCGFAKTVYDEVGPLDETLLGGGDETDFFWKAQLAGHTLDFVPEAVINYTQREHARDVFKQYQQYGRAHVKMYARFAADGMPRTSTVKGVLWWLTVPLRLLRATTPLKRDALARDLGNHSGRLSQALRSRTLYL